MGCTTCRGGNKSRPTPPPSVIGNRPGGAYHPPADKGSSSKPNSPAWDALNGLRYVPDNRSR